jgi:CO/xanthine dehydrogenase Mo-binding subunit
VVERLVDRAAREMKLDPLALRRRNFVPNDAYPYTTPVSLTYDSGDYFKTLEMAVKAADYAGFEQRRQQAAKRGKLRGIGICTYIEACAMAPSVMAGQLGEAAEVGTEIGQRGDPHAEEFAVLVESELGLGDMVARLIVGQEDLAALGGPFDRATEFARKPEHKRLLGIERALGAEAAAHIGRYYPQLMLR